MPAGSTTERGRAIVADRLPDARRLGAAAAERLPDAAAVAAVLRDGLGPLADTEYREGMNRVAPGIGPILGVRQPLLRAVTQALRSATRRDRSATVVDIAEQLLRHDLLELHWIAFGLLERTVGDEPERTWQLVRRAAARADQWVTVDTLAHVAARGIGAEPYRWSELEQLVYSPSTWERRLVGSSVAVLATRAMRGPDAAVVVRRGLALVADLIGDAEPQVQKALSWALRGLAALDPVATLALLDAETTAATATSDGARAWVIRDTLPVIDPRSARQFRDRLDGVRRRPGAASTSRAAATAAAFIGLGVDVPPADRPIIDRT